MAVEMEKNAEVGMRESTNSAQNVPFDYRELLHSFRKSVIITRKAKNIGPPGHSEYGPDHVSL